MAIPVSLGMPAAPPPVLAPRRKTRQLDVGGVGVGSDSPVSVQSMTTTKTADINATLQQIAELTAAGCQIVRVAVPDTDDAEALPAIAKKSQIPVIADIHFQPRYVFAAIDAGCAAVRVNPGNIKKFDDKVGEIAKAAKDAGIPIRIGVNAGSLDKRLLAKYGKATPEALVESALWECSLFEEHDFRDIKISVKHNDPVVMVRAYELLAAQCDYPLHLGVTEAGPAFQGTIKSAVAFGALLSQGIGDTIRVSLSAPPVEEVKVGTQILESLNLRQRGLEIVSCPSCGRAQVDVYKLADEVTAGLEGMEVPLRVAVMGCVVNGPGEAREADLGVASGNGKGQIFVKGEVIKTVPESQIVETLIEEAMRIAGDSGRGRRALRAAGRQRRLSRSRLLVPCSARRPPGSSTSGDERAVTRLLGHRSGRRLRAGRPGRDRGHRRRPRSGRRCGASAPAAPSTPCAWPGPTSSPSRSPGAERASAAAFAERARRAGRRCSTIVGPAASVAPLWELLAPRVGPGPRPPAPPAAAGHRRRRPRSPPSRGCGRCAPTSSRPCCRPRSRCSPRRSGVSPLRVDGGAGYRARVTELVRAGRSLAWIEQGEVLFKAEIGAVSRAACQVQGVWVTPGCRGRGIGAAGTAAVVEYARAPIAPVVSLYVNDFNAPARAAYRRVGFRDVGQYASVLF